MTNYINFFFTFFILILPISLITGPAIPDLTITFGGIFFLIILITKKKYHEIFQRKWVSLSIIFWLFLIFISCFAINKFISFKEAVIFIRILIIPVLLYYWILKDQKKIKYLSIIVFTSIIFVCLDSIYQFLNYRSDIGFGEDIFGYIPDFAPFNRLTGPFKDLIPGAYISKFSLIGLTFIFFFFKNEKHQNILIYLYLTLIGVVTFISGERMALATYLMGMILLIVFVSKRRKLFLNILILILILCSTIYKIHPSYNDFKVIDSKSKELGLIVEKKYECNDVLNIKCNKLVQLQPKFIEVLRNFKESAYGEIYLLSFRMWKENIFTGIGLNNFTYICKNEKKYKDSLKNIGCVTHPHNFYLQWLVETGFFGFILFLIYISLILKFVFKKNNNPIYIISFISLIMLFWPIMSTGSLLKNMMGITTFYIVGISLSLTNIEAKDFKF